MSIKLEDSELRRSDEITRIANLDPVYSVNTSSISDIVNKIIKTQHRMVPIVNKKKEPIGIVTTMDILDAFLRKQNFDDKISSIMIRDVITCRTSDILEFVLQKFKLSRRGGLPVLKNKKLVGMVSERDFIKYFSTVEFGIRASDVMTKKPFVISSSLSVLDCLKSLVNTHYRRVPIVSEGKLVGIVTAFDLLKYIKDHNYGFKDLDEPLDAVARYEVYNINEDADLSEVIKLMKIKGIGGILIVDDVLKGIITERDILEEII